MSGLIDFNFTCLIYTTYIKLCNDRCYSFLIEHYCVIVNSEHFNTGKIIRITYVFSLPAFNCSFY